MYINFVCIINTHNIINLTPINTIGEANTTTTEIFELTNVPVADLGHEFGPDATGHATSCKQNYGTDRAKDQTSKGYEKALYVVGLITTTNSVT
ncbi:MAG: hypothetical protein FWC30_00980 [Candidatus Bathyarchaeota archaeon]|nr:hypothetical protein [Candidatus Termiticorpusculum sp.]